MDIASLVGFILAYIVISAAIMMGGPFIIFVNAPSLLVVVGGTFAVTLMRVTMSNFLGSFKIGLKGFFYKLDAPQNLIDESVELANVARKEGILALEGREIGNDFLERGIGLCIDGHAELKQKFLPILKLIAGVLNARDGHFVISGHTDDIPIETSKFRSNWDLSAARAASVVHFFIREGAVDPERMEIRALADNEPIVPNDSWENRAQNRRVEISVLHGNKHAIESESPDYNVDYVKPEGNA